MLGDRVSHPAYSGNYTTHARDPSSHCQHKLRLMSLRCCINATAHQEHEKTSGFTYASLSDELLSI